MDHWDWALLVFAGYVAVTALGRLMARRREAFAAELRQRAQLEQAQQLPQQPSQGKSKKSA